MISVEFCYPNLKFVKFGLAFVAFEYPKFFVVVFIQKSKSSPDSQLGGRKYKYKTY